jgi:hypothetical protein
MFVLDQRATLAQLAEERRALDAAEAEWLTRVAAYHRAGRAEADGYASTAAALRVSCRMTHGTAHGHVELARKLRELPAMAGAFAAGEISRAHAKVIADAHTPERATAIAEIEDVLVTTAKRVHPRDLLRVVRHATDALDGDSGAAADAGDFALRRLHVSTTIGGIAVLDGRLAADQAEIVLTALDAELERDRSSNETRNPAQRRADALVSLCRRALDRGDVGGSRRVRPHVTVVVDLERLNGTATLISDARIEASHIGRLSKGTLDRIACDCGVSRVIMAGPSEIIDVGRATRTISPALWKALVARDRHCTHPGCDRPPGWCEVHHEKPWNEGGTTDPANCRLLCRHHHSAHHSAHHRARARARAPG